MSEANLSHEPATALGFETLPNGVFHRVHEESGLDGIPKDSNITSHWQKEEEYRIGGSPEVPAYKLKTFDETETTFSGKVGEKELEHNLAGDEYIDTPPFDEYGNGKNAFGEYTQEVASALFYVGPDADKPLVETMPATEIEDRLNKAMAKVNSLREFCSSIKEADRKSIKPLREKCRVALESGGETIPRGLLNRGKKETWSNCARRIASICAHQEMRSFVKKIFGTE